MRTDIQEDKFQESIAQIEKRLYNYGFSQNEIEEIEVAAIQVCWELDNTRIFYISILWFLTEEIIYNIDKMRIFCN